ncbi:DUF461 domain-containing protein [Streptomyces uncialis]|uniref:DUF461 domain-containing protein n=1 Tax=Streptomyces uncialis TaxID=1048205 RepID=UPI00382D7CF1
MSSSLRRGALAATAIAFSIASLAACGAGTNAQTLGVEPDNASTSVGDIQIENSNIITQPELEATGPAVLSVTLFNTGSKDQTLDAVALSGAGGKAELKPAKGADKLTVPAGGSLVLGGKDNASAVLPDGRESVKDGDAQNVTYTFSGTGQIKIDSFVVPATGYFEEWGPSEMPKPGPERKPAEPDASGSPSGDASGSPEGTEGTESGAPAEGTGSESPADGASADPAGSESAATTG